MMQKKNADIRRSLDLILLSVFRLSRTDGTTIGTGSAIDAFCGVDDVFSVAGFNCSDGAVFCAGSAFDAKIVDFVSHGDILLKKIFCFKIILRFLLRTFVLLFRREDVLQRLC